MYNEYKWNRQIVKIINKHIHIIAILRRKKEKKTVLNMFNEKNGGTHWKAMLVLCGSL